MRGAEDGKRGRGWGDFWKKPHLGDKAFSYSIEQKLRWNRTVVIICNNSKVIFSFHAKPLINTLHIHGC